MSEQLDLFDQNVSEQVENVPSQDTNSKKSSKRGRPKGSKNKKIESLPSSKEEQLICNQQGIGSSPVEGSESSRLDKLEKSIELLTKLVTTALVNQDELNKQVAVENAKSVKDKLENNDERKIRVTVGKDDININGVIYLGKGTYEVPESLANRIKGMIKDREDMKAREPIFVDHGVKKLAEFKGDVE